MSGVFISYRRDDRPGFAGRLSEALESVFGADQVFRDIEDIRPGEDFVDTIEQRIAASDLMLVVIGPSWLHARRDGMRRLEEPDDFVRIEIETALKVNKPVWPVLVGGGSMPSQEELPASIRALARRQAVTLTETGWRDDVARLITALRKIVVAPKPPDDRRRRFPIRLIVSFVSLLIFVGVALWWMLRTSSDTRSVSTPATTSRVESSDMSSQKEAAGLWHAPLAGQWRAQVRYDWGAEHSELLDLTTDGDEIRGTVSYLGVPRIVETGQWQNDRALRLTTRSESMAGSETRSLTHLYRGMVFDDRIEFTLETSGGGSPYQPVTFSAYRIGHPN